MLGSDGKVYLLDWGSARAEIVPHFELNEIIRASKPDKETLTTFLGGYGISSEAFEEMDPDLSVLNLLNEIDTLRWAIEKMPTRVRDKIGRVEEAITRFEEDK